MEVRGEARERGWRWRVVLHWFSFNYSSPGPSSPLSGASLWAHKSIPGTSSAAGSPGQGGGFPWPNVLFIMRLGGAVQRVLSKPLLQIYGNCGHNFSLNLTTGRRARAGPHAGRFLVDGTALQCVSLEHILGCAPGAAQPVQLWKKCSDGTSKASPSVSLSL